MTSCTVNCLISSIMFVTLHFDRELPTPGNTELSLSCIEQGLANFCCKEPNSKYFSLRGPVVSAAIPQLYHNGARTAIDSEYDYASKFFLCKPVRPDLTHRSRCAVLTCTKDYLIFKMNKWLNYLLLIKGPRLWNYILICRFVTNY